MRRAAASTLILIPMVLYEAQEDCCGCPPSLTHYRPFEGKLPRSRSLFKLTSRPSRRDQEIQLALDITNETSSSESGELSDEEHDHGHEAYYRDMRPTRRGFSVDSDTSDEMEAISKVRRRNSRRSEGSGDSTREKLLDFVESSRYVVNNTQHTIQTIQTINKHMSHNTISVYEPSWSPTL